MYIGITMHHNSDQSRLELSTHYVESVRAVGGLPVLLPSFDVKEPEVDLSAYLEGLSGLILSGGVDVDPARFGEEPLPALGEVSPQRDHMELALVKTAFKRRLPMLGICRGLQLLNIAAGGSVYQDLASQVGGALQHWQKAPYWHPAHSVSLVRETRLSEWLGGHRAVVNTLHHQAVKEVAAPFIVAARAPDGVIEALESRDDSFVVGVQWHPEFMAPRHHGMRQLFAALVEAARAFQRPKL